VNFDFCQWTGVREFENLLPLQVCFVKLLEIPQDSTGCADAKEDKAAPGATRRSPRQSSSKKACNDDPLNIRCAAIGPKI